MSAHEYARVPASQYKCNAYVAETQYRSLGLVFKVHAQASPRTLRHAPAPVLTMVPIPGRGMG